MTYKMSYTLASASVSDVPDIVTIFDAAFAADPFIPHFFTQVPQDVRIRYSIARYSQWFEKQELFGMHMWKVVDQQGYLRSNLHGCHRQANQESVTARWLASASGLIPTL